MSQQVSLNYDGKEIDLPRIVGSEGEVGIDIAKLRATTNMVTVDEGYLNTGSTSSRVTYLNGESGILRYRGYPIEVLAEKCDFVEVSYLLINGELPTRQQLEDFLNGKLSLSGSLEQLEIQQR